MKIVVAQYWRVLREYLLPQSRRLLLLAIFLFTAMGLRLVNPQILRFFVDAARGTAPMRHVTLAALAFIAFSIVIQVFQVASTYFSARIGWIATNRLRADLARHCLGLSMSFHNRHKPGEMIERIDGDVANLAAFFSDFMVRIAGSLLFLVGVLVVLFIEDWRIGLSLCLYSCLTLATMIRLRHLAIPHWKEAREASADLFGFIEEQLTGTEDVRANGAVGYAMRLLFRLTRNRLRRERAAGLMNICFRGTISALHVLGMILAMWLGYYLVRSSRITVGSAFMVLQYTHMLFRPLMQISHEMEQLQKAGASLSRIDELLGERSSLLDGDGPPMPAGALGLEFRDVTFAYGEGSPVLKDISLSISPGETLGVLGRTGSGKTTLARLLFRLYDPTAGSIALGGTDLRQRRVADLRRRVGMVTQNVQIFRGTARDNLTFFDSSVPEEKILAIISEMGLQEWYAALPNGLVTELQGGSGLSAGEAQLLAFTRVFMKDPGLVVLDEASSRLDPATEKQLGQAMSRLLSGRTGIIIAHRLSTVQRVDHILILEDGHIAELGNRQKLARDPGSRLHHLLREGIEEVLA